MKHKRNPGKSAFPLENSIHACFRRNGFDHVSSRQMRAFIEIMAEELDVPNWISRQDSDLIVKVLDRVKENMERLKAKSISLPSAPVEANIKETQPQ